MKVMISAIISLLLYSCLYSMNNFSISMEGGGSSKQNPKKRIDINSSNLNKVSLRVQQLQVIAKRDNGLSTLASSLSESEQDKKGKQKILGLHGKDKDIKQYSTSEVMDLIQKFTPLLSEFGQVHDIPLEELATYAHLLQEFHIDPTAMATFAKQKHNIAIHPKGHEIRAYQDIQTQNPNKYTLLLLEIFKEMTDQVNNVKKPTQLSDTHFNVLHTQVENQQDIIFKGKVG